MVEIGLEEAAVLATDLCDSLATASRTDLSPSSYHNLMASCSEDAGRLATFLSKMLSHQS